MGSSAYLKFILTVLTLAVIALGLLLLRAVDRQAAASFRIVDRLAEMQSLGGQRTDVTATPQAKAAESVVANVAFFDPAAEPGDRLISAIFADTQNMNTLINNDAQASYFHNLCSASLAERNYGKLEQFEPMLAESWTISGDRKSYHIKLRRGVFYHDFTDPVNGKKHRNVELTAHDFKFYVDVINNPDVNAAPLRSYYQDLEGLDVLNDYEFVVRWKKPYFGSLAFTLGMTPLPRHLYHAYEGPFSGQRFNDDHERNRILIGCGPYRFVRWDKGERVVFKRFENYFGNALGVGPAIDTLSCELYQAPNTRFQALLAGKLDILDLTAEQWTNRLNIPEFQSGKLKKYKHLSNSYTYIGYNLRNVLFQDKRVRQALTLLIDREKILREVLFGLGKVTSGPFFSETVYYDSAIKPWPFDPKRAAELLAQAGWRDADGDGILEKDGKKFSFTMLQINSSTTQGKMLPLIKEMFAAAGIDMQLQAVEWSVYVQRLEKRQFEACNLAWSLGLDPDPYQLWHSSQAEIPGSSNHVGFVNARADELIGQIRETFDDETRIKLCHEFHALLHEEQPYTFLFTPYALSAMSGRYRNVREFPMGIPNSLLWTPRAEQLALP